MNILITMAGLGSRFRKAGYDKPKHMIIAHNKTLFTWSMLSLEGYKEKANKYIFIVRREDNSKDFIASELEALEITNIEVIEIDYLTDGQATTAMLAKDFWNEDEELLIYNIDTFVYPNQMKYSDLKGDGFIPCFKGEGDHWSFVKLNKDKKAIEIREKVKISDNCTLGAYYFKSAKLYNDIYNEYYFDDSNNEKNEKYIAPMYNYMISKGMEIFISSVEADKVHVLGTPKELDDFKSKDIIL